VSLWQFSLFLRSLLSFALLPFFMASCQFSLFLRSLLFCSLAFLYVFMPILPLFSLPSLFALLPFSMSLCQFSLFLLSFLSFSLSSLAPCLSSLPSVFHSPPFLYVFMPVLLLSSLPSFFSISYLSLYLYAVLFFLAPFFLSLSYLSLCLYANSFSFFAPFFLSLSYLYLCLYANYLSFFAVVPFAPISFHVLVLIRGEGRWGGVLLKAAGLNVYPLSPLYSTFCGAKGFELPNPFLVFVLYVPHSSPPPPPPPT
jgi:hypothetical protein